MYKKVVAVLLAIVLLMPGVYACAVEVSEDLMYKDGVFIFDMDGFISLMQDEFDFQKVKLHSDIRSKFDEDIVCVVYDNKMNILATFIGDNSDEEITDSYDMCGITGRVSLDNVFLLPPIVMAFHMALDHSLTKSDAYAILSDSVNEAEKNDYCQFELNGIQYVYIEDTDFLYIRAVVAVEK